jgi:serine/threonine-protein kinase RsbW
MILKFSLTVDSRLERLSQIADFMQETTHACGLSDDQAFETQMAVDEACTNVIQHAYHGRHDGTIDIACEKRGQEFIITIQDYGDPFDPKKVARPKTRAPLSQRNVGGLGLFFMRRMMDRVKFDFTSGRGNRLTMVKKIKSK